MPANNSRPNGSTSSGSDMLRAMRALGVNGFAFSLISIALAALAIAELQRYSLEQFALFVRQAHIGEKSNFVLTAAISVAVWSVLLPVLLVAIFLPLRSAWIYGKVKVVHVLRESGEALRRTMITLHLTSRRLALCALPLIGVALLWRECFRRDHTAEITLCLGIFTVILAIGVLWSAVALISAAPLAILTQCSPFSAVTECRLAIKHSYRAHLLVDFAIWVACIAAGFYLRFFMDVNPWELASGLIGILLVVAILGIDFGVTCFKAIAEYTAKTAITPEVAAPQVLDVRERNYGATANSQLPNGQPVTIHIENLHLGRRN